MASPQSPVALTHECGGDFEWTIQNQDDDGDGEQLAYLSDAVFTLKSDPGGAELLRLTQLLNGVFDFTDAEVSGDVYLKVPAATMQAAQAQAEYVTYEIKGVFADGSLDVWGYGPLHLIKAN